MTGYGAPGPTGTVCDQCGAVNPPGARFCATCRSYLGWDETSSLGRLSGPRGGTGPAPAAGSAAGPGPAGPGAAGRQPAQPVPDPGQPAAGVRLDLSRTLPPVLPLGAEHRVTATVQNTGTLVDEFVFDVEPRVGWIRVEPSRLSVFPGREEQVTVVLAPPAVPAPRAGALAYRLVARSALHPRVGAAADASVTVGAVDALAAYLEPVAVEATTRAAARVVLRNDGNRPMPVTVFRADAEPGVRIALLPGRLDLWPGEPAEVAVRLRPARLRWRGKPERHGYRLRVQPHLGRPIDLDATVVQRPLFARWVLPLVLALILAPLLALGGIALARALSELPARGPAGTQQPAGTDQPADSGPPRTAPGDQSGPAGQPPTGDPGGGQPTGQPTEQRTEQPTDQPGGSEPAPPAGQNTP